MRKIAPHLSHASCRIANVWLLEDSQNRRFLIDTGHPIERVSLLANLWKAGIRGPGDLTAILLTHRHCDHAGNAAWLRKRFGARVVCHEHDADVLAGNKTAPRLCRTTQEDRETGRQFFYEKWLCRYEDSTPAICEVDETYTEGAWKWGFNIVSVPGHTEGSVMLYHEPSTTLFSGDAILVGYPFIRHINKKARKLRLADPAFSHDPESCHLAVKRYLKTLPPTELLCSGHGPVVDETAFKKLKALVRG